MWDDDRQTFLGSVAVYSGLGNKPVFSNVVGDMDRHDSMLDAAVACQDYMTVRKGMLL